MDKDFVAHERPFEGQKSAIPPAKLLRKDGAWVLKAFAHRSMTETGVFYQRHTFARNRRILGRVGCFIANPGVVPLIQLRAAHRPDCATPASLFPKTDLLPLCFARSVCRRPAKTVATASLNMFLTSHLIAPLQGFRHTCLAKQSYVYVTKTKKVLRRWLQPSRGVMT